MPAITEASTRRRSRSEQAMSWPVAERHGLAGSTGDADR